MSGKLKGNRITDHLVLNLRASLVGQGFSPEEALAMIISEGSLAKLADEAVALRAASADVAAKSTAKALAKRSLLTGAAV